MNSTLFFSNNSYHFSRDSPNPRNPYKLVYLRRCFAIQGIEVYHAITYWQLLLIILVFLFIPRKTAVDFSDIKPFEVRSSYLWGEK